jgi:hypothetical protein
MLSICNQVKNLPQNIQIAISDLATCINKANLMAMEHDTRLDILDKLVPASLWGTPKHRTLLTEMSISFVHVTKRNSIQI